jgi:hypothetical protein
MTLNKPNYIILAIIAATSLVLFSYNVAASSYAQTNATDNSTSSASMASNVTTSAAAAAAAAQSPSSGNPAVTSIDAGISAIKSGDNDGAKSNLYKAEVALEGNPNSAGAEKHVEAALKALKDGDTKGATFHAEEAKKGLS